MEEILVYHNGECSKCQSLTEILQTKGLPVKYKFYLYEPLTVDELKDLLVKLGTGVSSIVRTTEPEYLQFEGRSLSDDEWLEIIVQNPVLLQRPILVYNDKAIVARPAEKALEIL